MAELRLNELHFRIQRRVALMKSSQVGLDFITVRKEQSSGGTASSLWRLYLHFIPSNKPEKSPIPRSLTAADLRICLDGSPDPQATVLELLPAKNTAEPVLQVLVSYTASPSSATAGRPVHTLEIVELAEMDRFFAKGIFVFEQTPNPTGILAPNKMPSPNLPSPKIDYLSKDYESFRRSMLDRMAFLVPSWKERNPSDLGVTLVEALAYGGDYLSYFQDAVATEAYLETARRRVSVRRHVRLIDYRLHEGCNARCWVQVRIERERSTASEQQLMQFESKEGMVVRSPAGFLLPRSSQFLTFVEMIPPVVEIGSYEYQSVLDNGALVFQAMVEETLFPEHNKMEIYTWGTTDFLLPKGSTRAALRGHFEHLEQGMVLIIKSRRSPARASVSLLNRQTVRLIEPPLYTTDPVTGEKITEIVWYEDDALESDYPVSATVGGILYEKLGIFLGNIVLVDHGKPSERDLGEVPLTQVYSPELKLGPPGLSEGRQSLTYRALISHNDLAKLPARNALRQEPPKALPAIVLEETPRFARRRSSDTGGLRSETHEWFPRHDLLNSDRFARDFVVEPEDDDHLIIRFGNNQNGRKPQPGSSFKARLRLGVGPAGNVGNYSIRHLAIDQVSQTRLQQWGFRIVEAKNHLPGSGGAPAEVTEHARMMAGGRMSSPGFQRRCVTLDDYRAIAEEMTGVRAAAPEKVCTGAWEVVHLHIQREQNRKITPTFAARLRYHMEPTLLINSEIEICSPKWVPLDIQITVWLEPGVHPEKFRVGLGEGFENNSENKNEIFSGNYFTFNQNVYLSEVTTWAMDIPGIEDVRVDTFQRWGEASHGELENGKIEIAPLEIARIENDPEAPQKGIFSVQIAKNP